MLFTLIAPSGGGKEHLKKRLLSRFPQLKELCWTTTRALRDGEIQGVTRESVPIDEFDRLKLSGTLVLTQELPGGHYGIRKEFLTLDSGCFLTEFHIDNLIKADSLGLCPIAIGLVPVDMGFLEVRLKRRNTESPEQIVERMRSAAQEIPRILDNRGLFRLIVEFSAANEHQVADIVCTLVDRYINNASQTRHPS